MVDNSEIYRGEHNILHTLCNKPLTKGGTTVYVICNTCRVVFFPSLFLLYVSVVLSPFVYIVICAGLDFIRYCVLPQIYTLLFLISLLPAYAFLYCDHRQWLKCLAKGIFPGQCKQKCYSCIYTCSSFIFVQISSCVDAIILAMVKTPKKPKLSEAQSLKLQISSGGNVNS